MIELTPTTVSGAGTCGDHYETFCAFYQGTDCNNLTPVGCELMLYYDPFSGYLFNPGFSFYNLDSSQDLWIYLYGDGCWANLAFDVFGMAYPNNMDCATADQNYTSGCNVGAVPTTWGSTDPVVGPESVWAGGDANTCVGGSNWTSNENTVYYEVTATSSSASITIDNVICNDGTNGEAQFAIFEDCNCFMNAGYVGDPCFLGCSAGSGTVSLNNLIPGETYIIAVDGFAGDWCTWDFTLVGVEPLANESLIFNLEKDEQNAILNWQTELSESISHFVISRTGIDGEVLREISYSGSDKYTFVDEELNSGSYLYKIIQVDYTGAETVSEIKSIEIKQTKPSVYMNIASNNIEIRLNSATKTYNVSVYNNIGQEIVSQSISKHQSNINISNLNKGIYYVVLNDLQTTESFSYKILK